EPLKKITIGLIGIFFFKAASRRFRHQKNGVIDPVTGEVKGGAPSEHDLTEALYVKIAEQPNGMTPAEITAAFPDKSKPSLYREVHKLIKGNRMIRVGRPRTADVRYNAVSKSKQNN